MIKEIDSVKKEVKTSVGWLPFSYTLSLKHYAKANIVKVIQLCNLIDELDFNEIVDWAKKDNDKGVENTQSIQ